MFGLVLSLLLLYVWLCVCLCAFGFALISLLVDVLLRLCNVLLALLFACRGLFLVIVIVCSLCFCFVLWWCVAICLLLFV